MKRDLPDLLKRLAPITYPALCEEYTFDCCIAAASILKRVFKQHGHQAEVIPVTVAVFNAAMLKLLSHGPLPKDRQQRAMLMELSGAWGVGIQPASAVLSVLSDRRGGGYGGHLLLRVEDYLVDATIKQVDRPDKGIVMPPMIVTRGATRLLAENKLHIEIDGCVVTYETLNDQSYRTAPDWVRRSTPFPETVRKIISRVEAA